MTQLLELQKLLLEKLRDSSRENRSLSTASCSHHSCNGALQQQAEIIEGAMHARSE